jgi:hypothetical protein
VIASRYDGLGVVAEGVADAIFGRPITANPYDPRFAAEAHAAWAIGWREGRWHLEIRGQEEAARWLREAA